MNRSLIVISMIVSAGANVASADLVAESLAIPSNGSVVSTSDLLTSGHVYEVIVSGLYRYDVGERGEFADAQYLEDDSDVYSIRFNSVQFNGLALNANILDLPNHTHTYFIVGNGSNLLLSIFDSNYSDNAGSLSARVSAVPEPSTLVLAATASAWLLLNWRKRK